MASPHGCALRNSPRSRHAFAGSLSGSSRDRSASEFTALLGGLCHAAVMRWVVIVNGPPGSGKTTLGRGLSQALSVPLLSKDSVKETLLDSLGFADRAASRRIGAAAGEVLWTLLADSPTSAVLESWLAPSLRELVKERLLSSGIDQIVEVWCSCPQELAMARFSDRQRHSGHFDAEFLPGYVEAFESAEPLALGPVLVVDTSAPVELERLTQSISAALAFNATNDSLRQIPEQARRTER